MHMVFRDPTRASVLGRRGGVCLYDPPPPYDLARTATQYHPTYERRCSKLGLVPLGNQWTSFTCSVLRTHPIGNCIVFSFDKPTSSRHCCLHASMFAP